MIHRLDRHIDTLPFAPLQFRACEKVMNVSKSGLDKIMGDRGLLEDGYMRTFPKVMAPATVPGPGMDALDRAAMGVYAASLERLAAQGKTSVNLYEWLSHEIFSATTQAAYGPHNPFQHPENEKAWFDLEAGIITMSMGLPLSIFAQRAAKAREVVTEELTRYFGEDRQLEGSFFLQLRKKHNDAFGLPPADLAHTEIGQVAAGILNIAPTAFWMVWKVLSDPIVFQDCRAEAERLVQVDPDSGDCTIDLSQVRSACPILASTWKEVMRFYGVSTGVRVVHEDTMVDDQFLLKKGGMVLMPNAVIHTDKSLWGPTAEQFNHKRFLKGAKGDHNIKTPSGAFRGFGGGPVVCPGRYFVSTEMMCFMALLLVRFDVAPVGGKWVEPAKRMEVTRASPLPKTDVKVEFVPRSQGKKWCVLFSGNSVDLNISTEDL